MKQFVAELRAALHADGPILTGVAVLCAVLLAILAAQGVDGLHPESYADNLAIYLFALFLMGIVIVARLLWRDRPSSPIGYLLAGCRRREFARFAASGIPMLLALVVYMPVFSAMKSAIPLFNTYAWDPALIAADRAIHGTDAWRVLQPALGHPLITSALSVAYHAWITLVYAGGVYFCFVHRDREVRARYFIGFFAIWTVIGIALATGLASVGPCFVGPLFGDHSFDPQMAYLRAANEHYRVMVLPVQDQLLAWQQAHAHGLGSGISAMPSMHVGMATLFALAMWRTSRIAGILAALFAVTIALASVHLGYHYAVDGYVAATVTLAIWAAARPVASWIARRADSPRSIGNLGGVAAA